MYQQQQKGSVCPYSIVLSVSANCKRIATDSIRRDSCKKTICSIYPSSIVEGQHMYRQEEDGLTLGQLKKKSCTHSDSTIKGQLR